MDGHDVELLMRAVERLGLPVVFIIVACTLLVKAAAWSGVKIIVPLVSAIIRMLNAYTRTIEQRGKASVTIADAIGRISMTLEHKPVGIEVNVKPKPE